MNFNDMQEMFKNMSPEMKAQAMQIAKQKAKEKLLHIFSQPILIIVALVLGCIVGALTAFFGQVLLKVTSIREAYPFALIPLLALAGFLTIKAYKKFGKKSERGMDLVFDAGLGKEKEIPLRLIPMVAISTWATHLFGGSAGREGVAIQIGATLGHNISKKIHIENASRILLVAGMAAGFAGLFQTPMAAIALALEIMLVGHLELSALMPTTVAAFAACTVSESLGLEKFAINLTQIPTISIDTIFKLAVLGALFGILGGGFAKILSLAKKALAKKIPNPIKKIVIVGICLSVLLILFWQGRYAGLGTNLIDMCFNGSPDAIYNCDWILKFALTILTVAVGFKGGEVTPLFAIGATFGAVVATFFGFPPTFAAALGYAAVFGSATNTLFAPIFIGAEIFGFDALPAFFIVCIVAYTCNGGQSIYSQKKIRIH